MLAAVVAVSAIVRTPAPMMRIGQPDARLCKTHARHLAALATKSRGDRLTARRDRFLADGHAARHSRVIAPHEGWQASRNDQANVEHSLSQHAVEIATAIRISDDELDGRHLDRGGVALDRLRAARDAEYGRVSRAARRTSWSG